MQARDRYAYVNNNPLKCNDPSGHFCLPCIIYAFIGFVVENQVAIQSISITVAMASFLGPSNPDPQLINDPVASQQAFENSLYQAGFVLGIGEAASFMGNTFPNGETYLDDGLNQIGPSSGPSSTYTINKLPEVRSPNPVRPANVTNEWDSFLGEGPYNSTTPMGTTDRNRIFSADGSRSIRYGNHEMTYNHYHTETWTYDPVTDVVTIFTEYFHIQLK